MVIRGDYVAVTIIFSQSRPVRATWDHFRKMEWDVAILQFVHGARAGYADPITAT